MMDVDGNDNGPEWGYCTHPGCRHAAFPIWLSGDYPDDPDLFLCPTHIGSRMNGALVLLQACYQRLDDLMPYGRSELTRELWKHVGVFLAEMKV
jgi:hypothetical protein